MAGDEFGQSVAIAGDAIAVGAWKADSAEGAVYIFNRMGNDWIEDDRLTASDGKPGDEFGYSLAAFGNMMVIGAHFANSKEGVAYAAPLHP